MFDGELEQDRLFVERLTRVWEAMLAEARTDDLELLADGVAAFVAEVAWFEELGAERSLAISRRAQSGDRRLPR